MATINNSISEIEVAWPPSLAPSRFPNYHPLEDSVSSTPPHKSSHKQAGSLLQHTAHPEHASQSTTLKSVLDKPLVDTTGLPPIVEEDKKEEEEEEEEEEDKEQEVEVAEPINKQDASHCQIWSGVKLNVETALRHIYNNNNNNSSLDYLTKQRDIWKQREY
ncbi:hypothetical protein V5O48_009283 [Marasmius crinis-equi]|uniref:Uncharacterized protein n=1 Tax=Marasmius crinis-equi TaxID=585013 RepID=A0ABR3FBI3_9AGAR